MKKALVILAVIFAVVAMFAKVEAACVSYEVEKGDTLSGIAFEMLGNANLYSQIAEKNGIENPNLIFPGQVFEVCKAEAVAIENAPVISSGAEVAQELVQTLNEAKVTLAVQHEVAATEKETLLSVDDKKVETNAEKSASDNASMSLGVIGAISLLVISVVFAVAYMLSIVIHNRRIREQGGVRRKPSSVLKKVPAVEVPFEPDEYADLKKNRLIFPRLRSPEFKLIVVVMVLGVCVGLSFAIF